MFKKVFLLTTVAVAGWNAFSAGLVIDEVVVTASRIGVTDQRIVLIDEQEVDDAFFHAADALRTLPGFALSTSGHRGSLAQARVRGAESNHLLVLLDGIALNDPALGAEFDFGRLDFAGIQRVEYLSGPQSAVWGSDALAGVLYLDSTPQGQSDRLSVGFGSHGTIDADIDFSRVSEDRHVALSVGHIVSEGTNPAATGDENDGFSNSTANINLGADWDRWHASFGARHTESNVDYDPTPPPRYLPADGDRNARGRTTVLHSTLLFDASDSVESWITLAANRNHTQQYADGIFTDGTVGRRYVATLSTNFHFDSQHVNVTAELEREHIEQTGTASVFGDPNQRQKITTKSVASEYQIEIGWFAVTASVRADSSDAFNNSVAYRLGATFGEDVRWFSSLGQGVKNPTFTERFGFTPDTFIGNPDLEPETSLGFEAGVVLTNAVATASLVYFNTTLNDEIDGFFYDFAKNGFTARNIDGESHREGGEATLEAELGRFVVSSSYAYVDSTADNVRELRRPRHLGNVDIHATITPSISASFGVGMSGASLDRDFSTWPATLVELDEYFLARGKVDISVSPRWKLVFSAENLFNTDYVTVFGYRSPGFTAIAKAVYRP